MLMQHLAKAKLKMPCHVAEKRKGKSRKETTTPFGVNSMRSQVLYRAAHV